MMGKSVLLCGLLTTLTFATAAQAMDVSVLGDVGYNSATLMTETATGLDLGATLLVSPLRLEGGPNLLLGGGFKYSLLSWNAAGGNYYITTPTLGLAGGISFPVASKFNLYTLLDYDFALGGSYEVDVGTTKTTNDIQNFGRLNHEWGALFNLYSQTSIGAAVDWFEESFKTESNASSEVRFYGFTLKALIRYYF